MVTRQRGKSIDMVRDMETALSPSRGLRSTTREITEKSIHKEELLDKNEKFSKEMLELSTEMDYKKSEFQQRHKKLLELEDKRTCDVVSSLESQLDEKTKKFDIASKDRDKLERELINCKSDMISLKRTLELERQERRDLETRALDLIKRAKRKWELAEKEKIEKLNKHIESQTIRITELCTSNNEMSSKLQRTLCELETTNAELHKLKVFQIQYKESLAKTRELSRQSAQGVENKLEEIANRTHNQLADLRLKFEMEIAKNTELEAKYRHEQDSNHCRQSRLNVALELAQSELKDCQEQLRSTKAMIPARDTEIETLRCQLKERSKQLANIPIAEQTITNLQSQLEKLRLENERMKSQLDVAKSDLNETLLNLEQNEALTMEKIDQDKETLQQRLQHSLEKEEEQLRKVGDLEELLRRLEQSVTKLEAENASLKRSEQTKPRNSTIACQKDNEQKIAFLEHQVERLEQQLQISRDKVASERQIAKQAQTQLWKKEKELSDANLDKRIATREAKSAEERVKMLQDDKQKLSQQLTAKFKDEEEKSKKLLKELDGAKSSLADVTREATRNKLQADSAQKALTQANKQIEELQSSSSCLRRELDSTRKQQRNDEDRVDSLNAENKRLNLTITKYTCEKNELEAKLEKYDQEAKSHEVNIELLKETCTVLEEQLMDYERLTSDHETRENTLIQERMKLQKDLETLEQKLREAKIVQNEEKTKRLVAEGAIESLESEINEIETERNNLSTQRDQYKKLAQELTKQVGDLTGKCGEIECDLAEIGRALETARGESRVVKEECSQHLTRMHELKEANMFLMDDLQANVEQGQELRIRIAELESVLDDIRQFYQEREVKAEGTRYQQTKLIDYLTLKLEEAAKRKKTVCDKIFGAKQKENLPPTGTGMPVGYRELENQLSSERAKVKTLTEQLLALKANQATAPVSPSPLSPESRKALGYAIERGEDALTMTRQGSIQRMRHNIPHRFNIEMSMRAGKCAACLEAIQFGKRSTVCNECQIMTHPKCSLLVPANCGLPGDFAKHMSKNSWKSSSDSSLSNLGGSVQTLALDEPDNAETDAKPPINGETSVHMESWIKVPGRGKASWDRKYLRLEGTCLCLYEHQPSPGMTPLSRLELDDKNGFTIIENVQQADVSGTAKSDLIFVLRVESNSSTTCWPTSRLDIMTLSQLDKKHWLKALKNVASHNGPGRTSKAEKFQTIMRLEKNQLDLNCIVELEQDNVLMLGAEEGLFSYRPGKSHLLTRIRGVKKVHQLTLHSHLGLALMIAGEDRQLVSCDIRQLRSNALAAECSRPAINTKSILIGCESCHLYQLQGDILCAATATHVIILKWTPGEESGEFIAVRELETQEPCSCAIFIDKALIVGCHKFFQIELQNFAIDEFPDDDDNSVKAALSGVARMGIFPVGILNVSTTSETVELLLCYNEFGVFVNESGQRTRAVDPTWSHLPFVFAFRKPYLFVVHFSSVEVIKLSGDAFRLPSKSPERMHIEVNNARYLGHAGSRNIYVSATNSALEILRIDGQASMSRANGSLSSLDTLAQDDDSSSEFSFTSSLMEALDGQGKRVHFANISNH